MPAETFPSTGTFLQKLSRRGSPILEVCPPSKYIIYLMILQAKEKLLLKAVSNF